MLKEKKNILEKMQAIYDRVSAESDAGKRLLALSALEEKISKAAAEPEKYTDAIEFGVSSVVAGAAVTGFSILSPTAIPMLCDIIFGSAVGVYTFIKAHDVFERSLLCDHLANRAQGAAQARYIRDILPHVPALKDLRATVKADKKEILHADNLAQLGGSRVLPKLVKTYPDLMASFKVANEKAYAEKKAAMAADKNTPKRLDL